MTNTEAITKLTNIMHDDHYSWHPSILTAFNMAVDALKGADGDCISRKEAIEDAREAFKRNPTMAIRVMDLIKSMPSAQPEQRWISCKEHLPENREWVLGIFQEEGDTGWINPIPFICDYVGKKTPITTQDNWLLKMVDEPHPYYEKLHCIAWKPLPEPYRKEGETE